MNDKRKIEINIIEVQTHKILIQINSNIFVAVTKIDIISINIIYHCYSVLFSNYAVHKQVP